MKTPHTRMRLMASTIMGGTAFLGLSATAAMAQTTTTAPTASTPAEVQEVVVTGSRIPQPNLTAVSPVTAVSSQELKLQGTTNVETLLNNLPQVSASQTSEVANGATGIATVNLRGLGSVRTLVLVDGRRLMPGDPTTPVPDLNTIPASLVDRVDVLTGGASAVYGSDAIAGVVNFIMKKDFEGFQVDAQYNFYQHHNDNGRARSLLRDAPYPVKIPSGNITDGEITDITVAFGANSPDGKGNITAYAGYRHTEPVLQAARDYSACSVASTYSADPTVYDIQICAGSSNSAYGRFRGGNAPTGGLSLNPDGTQTFVDYQSAYQYNYGPLNYFQRPDDRYTAGFFAHYDLNDMVNLYADLLFSDDHTVAQIAPSGLFSGTGPNGTSTFGINCDNPLMTSAQQAQLCGDAAGTPTVEQFRLGFRFASLPRQDDLRHTNYRVTLGARGQLNEAWNYDAYIQYGASIYNEHYNNDVSTSRVQNALLVDPATGQCTVGASSGCVPLDLFRYNDLTPEMLAYVVVPGFKSGQTTEHVISASITGDLSGYGIKSPMANDGVGVAFGAEYRRESLDLRVDQEFASGDLSGQGGPTLGNSGSFNVKELFGELRVPIAQDQPFAHDLSAELGYRWSHYNTKAGDTNTYKIGLNWAPVQDLKVRASYNRAVRAPNVTELFTPAGVALFGGADPCAANNGGVVPATLEQCLRSGVTADQYNNGLIEQCPAAQCTALVGGNENLEAEKADTYTVGFVLRPSFLPGSDLSVDWFNIKVNNLISSLPNLIVADCVLNGNLNACSLFHRDPASGAIFGNTGYVDARNVNTGYLQTKGIDINANYRTNFSDIGLGNWGGLGLSFTGTYTDKYTVQPSTGAGTFDCAGLYGPVCSAITNAATGPIPKWRHKFRVTWTTPWPSLQLSADWRHLSSVKFDANENNVYLADPLGRTDIPDAKIKAFDYFDVSGTWKVMDTVTLRAGVQNIFDKDPPILDANDFPASGPPFGNGNTYPGTYDSLGRTMFVGFTADF